VVEDQNDYKSYRDLIVWQKSIDLAKQIHEITEKFPKAELYGLTSQLRRASVSIPSNIAEGQARRTTADFQHHLRIALGSLAEVDTQLVLAEKFAYLSVETNNQLSPIISEIRRMLHGLLRSLPYKEGSGSFRK
jgi:four helix bundle protein